MARKEETVQKREKIVDTSPSKEVKVERVLIENFVSLQHVMTNLAVKFENLTGQISKLLELFEISAKTLAEKGVLGGEDKDKKVAEKLDSLLEQNKVIAKGIALLHERNAPEQYAAPSQPVQRVQYPAQSSMMQRSPQEFSRNPKFRNMG